MYLFEPYPGPTVPPARPCWPQADFGLVIMMMVLMVEVGRNHDVGDDDQEALSGVAAEARLRISTVPIYQPARNVTLLASI